MISEIYFNQKLLVVNWKDDLYTCSQFGWKRMAVYFMYNYILLIARSKFKKNKTFCMMSFCMKAISNLRNLIVTLKMPELCYNLAFTFSVNECVHFESCIFPLQHNEDSPVEWQGLYFHMWSILYAINCLVMVRPLLKLHNWSFRPTESCRVCS